MYQKNGSSWLKHLDFIILDLICMEVSFLLSYVFRNGKMFRLSDDNYRDVEIILLFIFFVVVFFNESYSGILRRGYFKEFVAVFKHVTYIIATMLVYLFFVKQSSTYSRVIFISMWGIYIVLSYVTRLAWKQNIKRRVDRQEGKRSLLLVTSADVASEVVKTILKNNFESLYLDGIAIIDVQMTGKKILGVPVVADKDSMVSYIQKNWVDEVFFNPSEETVIPNEMIKSCASMGVTIHMKLAKLEVLGNNQIVEKMAGYTVLSSSIKMASPRDMFLKRAMDIVGGLVGVLMTGILTVFIAPIIKIKSPGPVFFSQIRVGKNGKKFKIYKFRSMYMDAEARKKELMEKNKIQDGLMFKMDNDPRIIKGIGNFIRKTSLDEFPQFWNVLKGDMSLVGTRPPTVDEWEKYEVHHRKRLAIKPGITGMWQVSGRSEITDFEKVVELDTEYITNWNLGLDLKLLWRTVVVVFRGEGSM